MDRKRAFRSLDSKAVTAYKKRRKADRNRVEKKFFLDNGLPAPQPEDIAENDAGLPRATASTRVYEGPMFRSVKARCHRVLFKEV